MTPIEVLSSETERINPLILLAEQFMRREAADVLLADDVHRAEKVCRDGQGEIEAVKRQLAAFYRTRSSASPGIPTGF